MLGAAFADSSLLDGEFDEFFLRPLATQPERLAGVVRILRSFDPGYVRALGELHRKIDVPVALVWGDQDPFFALPWAEEMAGVPRRHADRGVRCRVVRPRRAPGRGGGGPAPRPRRQLTTHPGFWDGVRSWQAVHPGHPRGDRTKDGVTGRAFDATTAGLGFTALPLVPVLPPLVGSSMFELLLP